MTQGKEFWVLALDYFGVPVQCLVQCLRYPSRNPSLSPPTWHHFNTLTSVWDLDFFFSFQKNLIIYWQLSVFWSSENYYNKIIIFKPLFSIKALKNIFSSLVCSLRCERWFVSINIVSNYHPSYLKSLSLISDTWWYKPDPNHDSPLQLGSGCASVQSSRRCWPELSWTSLTPTTHSWVLDFKQATTGVYDLIFIMPTKEFNKQ